MGGHDGGLRHGEGRCSSTLHGLPLLVISDQGKLICDEFIDICWLESYTSRCNVGLIKSQPSGGMKPFFEGPHGVAATCQTLHLTMALRWGAV